MFSPMGDMIVAAGGAGGGALVPVRPLRDLLDTLEFEDVILPATCVSRRRW